jgi:hypothetical protein
MRRARRFLFFLVPAGALLWAGCSVGGTSLGIAGAPPPPAPACTVDIPITDAHDHIMPGLTADEMISVLDQAEVCKILLMGHGLLPPERDEQTLAAYEAYPDRVIPFLGLNGYATQDFTPGLLAYLDMQLASGPFRGMGELLSRHYGFSRTLPDGTTIQAGDYTLPMDSPEALDVMCLAAKRNAILNVHMESTDETVAALDEALDLYPNTKVIWAHQTHLKTYNGSEAENARQADPGQIAALMDEHPNLYADIAIGYERFFLTESDLTLPEAWADLYATYSDRFVVGFDQPFVNAWDRSDVFIQLTQPVRSWLSQLGPEVQRKLAYENIERILEDEPASGVTCEFQAPTVSATLTRTPTSTRTPMRTATPTRTSTRTQTPRQPGRVGDVNCNGEVNSIDAALLLQLVADLIDSLSCQENADTNEDGTINAIDAALILQYVAGFIDTLPV